MGSYFLGASDFFIFSRLLITACFCINISLPKGHYTQFTFLWLSIPFMKMFDCSIQVFILFNQFIIFFSIIGIPLFLSFSLLCPFSSFSFVILFFISLFYHIFQVMRTLYQYICYSVSNQLHFCLLLPCHVYCRVPKLTWFDLWVLILTIICFFRSTCYKDLSLS